MSESLQHFGVKGMKWGVRKARLKEPEFSSTGKSFHSQGGTRTMKLKDGGSLTLGAIPNSPIAKFIAKVTPNGQERLDTSAMFHLKDPSGKTVGNMQLYKESPTSMNVVWVGVDKNARGRGYASAAMDGAIKFARDQKLKTVTLEVPGNAPDARHIYEKKGFKVVKEDIDPDDPVWGGLTTMKLDLNVKHSYNQDDEFIAHFSGMMFVDELLADDVLAHSQLSDIFY